MTSSLPLSAQHAVDEEVRHIIAVTVQVRIPGVVCRRMKKALVTRKGLRAFQTICIVWQQEESLQVHQENLQEKF